MMLAARQYSLAGSLILLSLLACDRSQPVEPAIEAASTRAGPSVKAPSNTNGVAVSETRIDVSWQDNSTHGTGFEVHRSTTGPSGPFTLRAPTGANVTSYSDAGLEPLTQYCYKVRALTAYDGKTGYSDFSNTTCATTFPPPAPTGAPPNAPSETGARPLSSTLVTIWWTDNATNEDGFRVERSTNGGASWAISATTGASADGWGVINDDGRTSEQQACYRVIAFNGKGDSPPSNTACTTPPAGPTNLTVTVTGPGTDAQVIDVTWTDNSAVEDGYQVQLSDYDGYCGSTYALPANSTRFTTTTVSCLFYQQWYITVVATRDGGFSDAAVP